MRHGNLVVVRRRELASRKIYGLITLRNFRNATSLRDSGEKDPR